MNKPQGRVGWVDVVKGLTIMLVVLWHTIGHNSRSPFFSAGLVEFNNCLILLRMPLFFFVAGFFVEKSLVLTWRDFLGRKVVPFLWLYLLWSELRPLSTDIPWDLWRGVQPDVHFIFQVLHAPGRTIWFIYALVLVFLAMRLTVAFPRWTVIVLSIGAYCVAVADGEHRNQGFFERVVELFPFFVLGSMAFPFLDRHAGRVRWWYLSALVPFFMLSPRVLDMVGLAFSPIKLGMSVWGIGCGLVVGILVQRLDRLGAAIHYLGRHSLEIYLLHFWPVFVAKTLIRGDQVLPGWLLVAVVWLASIAFAIGVSHGLKKCGITWLFSFPKQLDVVRRSRQEDGRRVV